MKWMTKKTEAIPLWLRMTLAGVSVGLCAVIVPEVMGVGYDTVNHALFGEFALTTLALILLFKFIATIISIGMGLPAGFISPILFMGAMVGSATGLLVATSSAEVSAPGLYAMLGMGAMMGAALQAPLAALLALLELTANENIIFPGMLAIISATLATREMFKQKSVYLSQMQGIGLDYRNDPIAQSLRRLAVSSVMNKAFTIVGTDIDREQAQKILTEGKPNWLVIHREEGHLLLPAADLARFLEESPDETIDLLEVPSKRQQLAPIRQQSTLQQAHNILDETGAEALYVIRPMGTVADQIYGIVTRSDIEAGYRLRADDSFF